MRTFFAAAFVGFALALPAGAQDANALAGTYCGKLWSAGKIVDVVTELGVGKDGRLVGKYEFDDAPADTKGTLREERPSTGRKRTLIWQDVYGTGKLVIAFDMGLDGFTGLWGADWEEPDAQWDGGRCDRTISALDTGRAILR